MAQVTETESNLLPNGGGRTLFGQNLKIVVFFVQGIPPAILENGGQDTVQQSSGLIGEGGEDSVLQPDNIQHDAGEDSVI